MAVDRRPKPRQALSQPNPVPATLTENQDEPSPEAVGQAEELLRPLLRDPTQASQTVARIIAVSERFSGPIPHPRHFEAYEQSVPGSGREILEMAKKEQRHRHSSETLEIIYPYIGLGVGFLAFAGCIAGSIFLALHGHDTVAALMLGVPVLGVIGWFINSRISGANDEQSAVKGDANKPKKRR